MKKRLGYAVLIAATALLMACGQSLSGTYEGSMNAAGMEMKMGTLEFVSGNKVLVDVMGAKTELSYEIDGKNLKFITPQGTQIWTIKDDGTIAGPGGVIYKKKS